MRAWPDEDHADGWDWEQHEIAFWALCEDLDSKDTFVVGMHRFDAQQPGHYFLPPEGYGHDEEMVGYRSPSESKGDWKQRAKEHAERKKQKA